MSNPNYGFHTTAEEVASAYSSHIIGFTILITGVSPNSLGLYTAKALAAHSPALIILAGRSTDTLTAAEVELKSVSPSCPTKLLTLDLNSLRTVRAAAEEVNAWSDVPKIDILINNAGIMSCPFQLSEDGIESQFAVNHLGPWLFTNLLMPKLIAASGRIVILSSIGHVYSPVRFEDYNFGKNGEDYDPDTAYGQSKTANILAAMAFAEKLKSRGVTAFSLHPGAVLTGISRHMSVEVLKEKGILDEEGNLTDIMPVKTHSQGCATILVAALDSSIVDRSGAYLIDCRVDHKDLWADHAKSETDAERLWKLSEELVGERFEYSTVL
jgi:NAD(P)-dependent dehydrogenase (short-subunit alcohol dehydrogenase family)